MKNQKSTLLACLTLVSAFMFSSCTKDSSSTTGWNYNDSDWGGFERVEYAGQETGPGLVLIEGGSFAMGQSEQDVMYEHHNVTRKVTVKSFYMDQTEISNLQYREYLYWLGRVFGADYPEVQRKALPDTLVWRDELAYNEPYVEYYLRHPAYANYPVVGVSWLQANDYCKWRTDRVNELLLISQGILDINPNQVNEDNFNTDAYLIGQYEGMVKKNLPDLNPSGSGERRVKFEDGIVQPDYRLPTEAEWEFAALALAGNQPYPDEERITDRKIYPWNGTSVRFPKGGGWQGTILANFVRGQGDYMGMAGKLNDNAEITAPVDTYFPNDYGLFNMAGNVSEWVMDVYRPMSTQDVNELNPFRGNVFMEPELDADGIPVEKDSLGRVKYVKVKDEDNVNRTNYKKAEVINYNDGDEMSAAAYNYGVSSLINNKARVYKGGSWADRAYYLSPGSRRFMDEERSTAMVGFRCAMDRVGSPSGNDLPGGNQFKKR
ncbi:MAG: SUMF1/EgtB/PvdO family nonheme iron enzyme [Chitinophagales bacterium]|nr:SUMF1/EgtB/PvdO family nonheme iron enzyme [Chitinophagales bacterium]